MKFRVSHPTKRLNGEIILPSSKSISNRLLIIQKICSAPFVIQNLSKAHDTQNLIHALQQVNGIDKNSIIDTGDGGTTFRFLLTYLTTLTDGEFTLTGSNSFNQRPIKELVETLNKLGASISYLENEGMPPLKIKGKNIEGGKVKINSNVSSQFISALLLIAPTFKNGLELELIGEIVSPSYIQMTIALMKEFGINVNWIGNKIEVFPSSFTAKSYEVENDWSAAAFWLQLIALCEDGEILLPGLQVNSLQGDSISAILFKEFGVVSNYSNDKLLVTKSKIITSQKNLSFDLNNCPDLSQALTVTLAAKKSKSKLKGISTLYHKETDRARALQIELQKLKVNISLFENEMLIDAETLELNSEIAFETYNDHRMAMSFAPLALLCESVIINNPNVVIKSYPHFWEDLKKVGFVITEL